MRVLYDHQMFTIQRFGGITRIFIELARQLSQAPGCAIHWYRGLYRDGYQIGDFRDRLARYWAFPAARVERRGWAVAEMNRCGLKWFVRTTPRSYDVYHPTYYDDSLLGIVQPKRLAVTVHDMITERFLADQAHFQGVIAGKRRLVEAADVVFANSERTRQDLLDMIPVDPAKVRVTYWASRIDKAPAESLPTACQGAPYFLYVGTRSKYKNFEVLMHAVAADDRLRSQFKIVCFGGSGDYLEPELRFFDANGMRDRFVYCTGNDAVLKALYGAAAALVYTSRYEGFGLPPLEAMQCGCPVICAPTSSLPEVVGDAALFFDVDAPEQLADCMRRVAEETELRARLVQKGHARAALFSWERTAQATLDGYRAVCG